MATPRGAASGIAKTIATAFIEAAATRSINADTIAIDRRSLTLGIRSC
jgi:hypothetical protein